MWLRPIPSFIIVILADPAARCKILGEREFATLHRLDNFKALPSFINKKALHYSPIRGN